MLHKNWCSALHSRWGLTFSLKGSICAHKSWVKVQKSAEMKLMGKREGGAIFAFQHRNILNGGDQLKFECCHCASALIFRIAALAYCDCNVWFCMSLNLFPCSCLIKLVLKNSKQSCPPSSFSPKAITLSQS